MLGNRSTLRNVHHKVLSLKVLSPSLSAHCRYISLNVGLKRFGCFLKPGIPVTLGVDSFPSCWPTRLRRIQNGNFAVNNDVEESSMRRKRADLPCMESRRPGAVALQSALRKKDEQVPCMNQSVNER